MELDFGQKRAQFRQLYLDVEGISFHTIMTATLINKIYVLLILQVFELSCRYTHYFIQNKYNHYVA